MLPLLSKGGYFWIENALEYSIVRNENISRFFFFLLHLYAYRIRLAVRFLVEHAMWWAKNRNVNANIGGHISPISCCMLCWSSFESSQIKLIPLYSLRSFVETCTACDVLLFWFLFIIFYIEIKWQPREFLLDELKYQDVQRRSVYKLHMIFCVVDFSFDIFLMNHLKLHTQ